MKIRQKLLLEKLLCEVRLPLSLLAEEFSVSSKTIRNDLSELAALLEDKTGDKLLLLEDSEVTFRGDKQAGQRARDSLKLDDLYLYKLSSEERAVFILSQLLACDQYLTIGELAEQLFVSRGTVNGDLQLVKSWCAHNHVQIQFKKSRGIILLENERRRRELSARLVQDFKSLSGIENLPQEGGLYGTLFKGVNMSAIKDVILDAEEKFQLILSDVAYEGLIVHIALSIRRDRQQSEPPNTPQLSRDSLQYRMASYIVAQLNEQLEVGLGEASVGYITLHIFGKAQRPATGDELPYAQVIAERLIQAVSKRLSFDFRSDSKLYDALLLHICAAISRIQNHLLLQNPIKDTIMAEYPDIYRAVCAESALLTGFTGCLATDDELAYIVIHFACAMEREKRLNENNRVPNVIIVCSTGVGTARLVQDQVERAFKFHILAVVPAHRLAALPAREQADFIISTVPLQTDLPVVLVSPVIRDAELGAINQMVIELGFNCFTLPRMADGLGTMAQAVQALVTRYGRSNQEQELLEELERLVGEYRRPQDRTERTTTYMLSEVLKKEYISLHETAQDWQHAVRLGGGQLLRNAVVEPEYVQAAIQNVKDLGPYIVLTKGVAVPHAGAEFGVHSTAISLVSLKEPVCFGNPDNDPVRYVFTLATTDSKSHLQALKDLVSLFDTPAFFETIDRATDPDEVVKFIKDFEQSKGKGRKEGTA